jgi:hypothetical protein
VTDTAGNVATAPATYSQAVDTAAPTPTLTTGSSSNTGNATVQSTEVGTAYLVKSTVTVTDLASITGSGDTNFNSVSIATANSNTSLSLAGLVDGSYKLYVVDAAGNLSTAAGTTYTVTSSGPVPGDPVIDLGGFGKLINPVQVESKWYYHWDRSGDGTSANSGSLNSGVDNVNHNTLDSIFNQDINGITNTTVANADGFFGTTDTYRYATLNGVKVALPTYGGPLNGSGQAAPPQGINQNQNGTAVANNTTTDNPTYNDLLAIWDSFNGVGTGTQIDGSPVGWKSSYWSATPSTTGHVNVALTVTGGQVASNLASARQRCPGVHQRSDRQRGRKHRHLSGGVRRASIGQPGWQRDGQPRHLHLERRRCGPLYHQRRQRASEVCGCARL